MSDERKPGLAPADRDAVAAELRRVRDEVRSRALLEPATLPASRPVREPEAVPQEAEPAAPPPAPPRPDNAALNQAWDVLARAPAGLRGRAWQVLQKVLQPVLGAQVAFNSRQVQFDNELLS